MVVDLPLMELQRRWISHVKVQFQLLPPPLLASRDHLPQEPSSACLGKVVLIKKSRRKGPDGVLLEGNGQ